jgi:uncharacterized membrane protein
VLTIVFHFLPWRFFIVGYRFTYHGLPSLIITMAALFLGLYGTIRNWRQPKVNWPWIAAIILLGIQIAFLTAFLQGPDTAIGSGTTVAPWGESPIEMSFDIRPLWGAYAAFGCSVASLAFAVLSLLANRSPGKK